MIKHNKINGKEFYYDTTIQSFFYIINNNLTYTNKEHIKRECWDELKEKSGGDEEKIELYKKELKNVYGELLLNIPNVNPIFDINEEYGFFKKNNENYFNMFKKTKIMKECKELREDKTKIHNDINFYKKYNSINILLENLIPKEEEREYFLNWISYIFNTLKKTRNSIVLKGIQGTGKGVFSEYILERYFGEYLIYTSNDDLGSKFNSNLMNKLMNVGNELINFEDKRDIREKLKQWITEDYIRIEEKGIKSKLYKNSFNMIIFSNNKNPVNIESSDRRFSIIETNNVKLLDILEIKGIKRKEYFDTLKKESYEFIKELCLYNYNEEEITKLLENEEKEDIRLDTEDKTNILKRKLETIDKNFFVNTFTSKFLFETELSEYKEILNELKILFINDNEKEDLIEYNHNFIVDETFRQLKEFGGVESKYILYYLKLMYLDKYTKKQLEQKLNNIGKGKRVYIVYQNGEKKRTTIREIRTLNNKNNSNIKTEKELLEEQLKQLKEETEKLKKEVDTYKNKNEELKKSLEYKENHFNKLLNTFITNINKKRTYSKQKLEEILKESEKESEKEENPLLDDDFIDFLENHYEPKI